MGTLNAPSGRPNDGGPLAIAGFVYQFLHNIDRILEAGLAPVGAPAGTALIILEPGEADAAYLGPIAEFVQYKTKRGRAWSPAQILFEILPPLLRAALAHQGESRIRFVTSGRIAHRAALDAIRQRLASEASEEMTIVRIGRRRATVGAILDRIYQGVCGELSEPGLRARIAALVGDAAIDESVSEEMIENQVHAQLVRATGTAERAIATYQRLLGEVARLSCPPIIPFSPDALLANVGLDRATLAPIREFSRRIGDLARNGFSGIGYDPASDVRPLAASLAAGLHLVSGESGSGKTWRIASAVHLALQRGEDALFIARATSLADLQARICNAVWCEALARGDPPFLSNLARDLSALLNEDAPRQFLVAVDEGPLNDRLFEEIVAHDWAADGIVLLLTVTLEQADRAQQMPGRVTVETLGNFTQAELGQLMALQGADWRRLPEDMRDWLAWPVLASLHARIAATTPEWRPEDEYDLLDAFARRADQWGSPGSRSAVRKLGQAYLRHGYPLHGVRLSQRQERALRRVGWLRTGAMGGLEFGHDRLLAWGVAEALAAGPDKRLVDLFLKLANYRAGPAHLSRPGLGNAIMDSVWLIAARDDGPKAIEKLLKTIDGLKNWHFIEAMYQQLLPTGGNRLLETLVQPLIERVKQPSGDMNIDYLAGGCLAGFARALRRPAPGIARRLMRDRAIPVQAAGLGFFLRDPSPRAFGRILRDYDKRRRRYQKDLSSDDLREWLDAAYRAMRAIVEAFPSVLSDLHDRAGDDQRIAWTLGLILECPSVGRPVWERHGPKLIERFGAEWPHDYFLAHCVDTYSDMRAVEQLQVWCARADHAAVAAWPALFRLDPDAAIALLETCSGEGLGLAVQRWLAARGQPREGELERVAQVLRQREPSGRLFGYVLRSEADRVPETAIAWAAERLDVVLSADPLVRSAVRANLLSFMSAIGDPGRIRRLDDLSPVTLSARIADFALAKLAVLGLDHDPEFADALTLLRLFGDEEHDRVVRAWFAHSSPNKRWKAVREAGFAGIAVVKDALLAIATEPSAEEPARCDALATLAGVDPDWAERRVRWLIERGAPADINEAYWLAVRVPGNAFADEALERLDAVLEHQPPGWRLVEYLISRSQALPVVIEALEDALGAGLVDRAWILERLALCPLPQARDLIIDEIEHDWASGNRVGLAHQIFRGLVQDAAEPRWREMAARLTTLVSARSLRHSPYFYAAAAELGSGPLYDQLLSDAHPAEFSLSGGTIAAIAGLAKREPASAAAALTHLLRLTDHSDSRTKDFLARLAGLEFEGVIPAIIEGMGAWPDAAILTLVSRLDRTALKSAGPAIKAQLHDPDPAKRRMACILAPWSGIPLPDECHDDVYAEVRTAAGKASFWRRMLATADRLVAWLDEDADTARKAAAALFALNRRSDQVEVIRWRDLAERLPADLRSLILAMPSDR